MAVPHESRHGTPDGKRARRQTKTLGVLVAVMVVAGVVALILTLVGGNSGGSQAASQPSASQVDNQTSASAAPSTSAAASTSAAPTSTAAATTAPPASSSATPTATPTPKATKSSASAGTATKIVKYRVKAGDNLTLIASWFNQRGYGLVYDWNKSVIGQNPNLIHPGQTIIVSLKGDHMKVATKTS